MKPRQYCCCAIPTVNAGIYATLVEQFVLAFVVGTLSVATPHIVGAATPSFAPWILSAICYVAAGVQVMGIIGVTKEKSVLYRRYVTLHLLATVAAFSVAVVWIIISASRHTVAQAQCENDFFNDGNDSTLSEGEILCNIFPWIDIGLMGGLWVLFAITQFYFYIVVSAYGTGQRQDHEKYDALPSPTQPLNSDIPMTNRGDAWDSRPLEGSDGRGFGHSRDDSDASVSTVLGDKLQQTEDGVSGHGGGYDQGSYPPRKPTIGTTDMYDQDFVPNRHRTAPSYPADVYTQEPGPTPHLSDDYFSGSAVNDLDRPTATQSHPAEGSFGRKTPRIAKPDPNGMDFDRGFFPTGRT